MTRTDTYTILNKKIGEDVMYKIVICDDDKNFISYMKEMLLRCDLSERQVTFYEVTSGEECLLTVKTMTSCDLIILDMQMSGMDGHATAKRFRKLCFDEFDFYLIANYEEDKMLLELTAVVEKMKQMKKRTYVMGKNHMNIVKAYPDDILYIDNYKRGSEIHVQENYKDYSFEDRITTKRKLAELYTDLKGYGFEYAHNSYIVNLNHVVKLKSEGVIKLSNGEELNVSRSRMPEFRRVLAAVMSEKYK